MMSAVVEVLRTYFEPLSFPGTLALAAIGPEKMIGIITGSITIVAAIVGVATYITRLQSQLKIERLENEVKKLNERNSDLEQKYVTAIRAGNVVLQKKSEVDSELLTLTDAVEAAASSILVLQPVLKGAASSELVFISLIGENSDSLKGVRVPMGSIAGEVYRQRIARISGDPAKETSYSQKTDQVSKSTTREMLVVPLLHMGQCVGVVEFLNKKLGRHFDQNDLQLAERLAGRLSSKVAELVWDPGNFVQLGITPQRTGEEAAILFSDLTGSSRLTDHLNEALVIDIINEYFENLCETAMEFGGTVDKFIGDGFMATFNVPRRIDQHELAAVRAAILMQTRFDELKEKWKIYNVGELYNRIGVTCGLVQPAAMGHPQFRQLTVMGEAVNSASYLCELGPRNRNVILIGDSLAKRVSGTIDVAEFQPRSEHSLNKGLALRSYEVGTTPARTRKLSA